MLLFGCERRAHLFLTVFDLKSTKWCVRGRSVSPRMHRRFHRLSLTIIVSREGAQKDIVKRRYVMPVPG